MAAGPAGAGRPAARERHGRAPLRLDLAAIERALRELQRDFDRINRQLAVPRDPLSDDVLRNLVAGYAAVDRLLAAGVDLFAMGHVRECLELNTIVLCGTDRRRREEFAAHREATERRFYDRRDGGIGDLVEWYARHASASVWERAAGVYVNVLSKPQLFIEGNHRTGALLMSSILAREGQPPFVLTAENAAAYFDPSTVVRGMSKHGLRTLFRLPRIRRQLARVLERHADPRFALASGAR